MSPRRMLIVFYHLAVTPSTSPVNSANVTQYANSVPLSDSSPVVTPSTSPVNPANVTQHANSVLSSVGTPSRNIANVASSQLIPNCETVTTLSPVTPHSGILDSDHIRFIRKWYDSDALMCRVSYLLRHLYTKFWLTTQGVNIISAPYTQSIQSIIKAFYSLLIYKSLLKASSPCILSAPSHYMCDGHCGQLARLATGVPFTKWLPTCNLFQSIIKAFYILILKASSSCISSAMHK